MGSYGIIKGWNKEDNMVIDVHYHPAFIKEVCGDEELAERRRNDMAYIRPGLQRWSGLRNG